MAITVKATEIFNEPIDRLCENLLANLNKDDSGMFDTYWEALHADEFTLGNQQLVRLIWGATNAYYPYQHGFFHFLMKFTALSATGCQVDFVVGLRALPIEDDSELKERLYRGEYQTMQSLADKVMELCVNPQAETNVGLISRFRKLLEGGKDKGKTEEG